MSTILVAIHTEGLSGPLSLDDLKVGEQHGNLLKLVYEIGRSRNSNQSGGSWGLGKTVYFRLGAGLVIYYSRVLGEQGFEERLVACLVEDETAPERLHQQTNTGVSWWGAKGGKPVTDVPTIRTILKSLDIRAFEGSATGTAIVIPFLRDDLIPESVPDDDADEQPRPTLRPWWQSNYADYISVALQRWYSIRIGSNCFGSPRLHPSVNGKVIHCDEMLPVFRAAHALFEFSERPTETPKFFSEIGLDKASSLIAKINLQNTFIEKSDAGTVVAALLTPQQLGMGPPDNNYDPSTYIFGQLGRPDPGRPLVTFIRRPGMNVRWDDSAEARGWAGGFTGLAGKFVIALFVPNLSKKLKPASKPQLQAKFSTLESYLRSCEKADHFQWTDQVGFTIINRIRSGVAKRLKEFFVESRRSGTADASTRAARNLADKLLPRGFGTDGRHGISQRPTASKKVLQPRSQGMLALHIDGVAYGASAIKISWQLDLGGGEESRKIALAIDSELGPIGALEWKKDFGSFPLRISSVSLKEQSPIKWSSNATEVWIRSGKEKLGGRSVSGELTIEICHKMGRELRPLLIASKSAE